MKLLSIIVVCMTFLGTIIAGCQNEQVGNSDQSNNSEVVAPVQSEIIPSSSNIQRVTFQSESLDKEMKFNIYLPNGYEEDKKYPVLYMIHGYGGDENSWMTGLDLEKTADKMLSEGLIKPLIIVTPDVENSYGFNSNLGDYSDYIVRDLIEYVDSHYSTDAIRESRYIGGLSMGGWVALHNAFLYPELFSKVGGHSPAVWMDDWTSVGNLESWLYPTKKIRAERDPIFLAETQDLSGYSVYLDSGDTDSYKFYQGAEALHNKLQSMNVDSEYHLSPGGHDGVYWMMHSRDYLLFYAGL